MKKRYQRIGYSILIIGMICAILYLSASQSNNPYSFLTIWFWFLLSGMLGGIGGGIFLTLRIAGLLKNKATFFYVFSAVLNLSLGLFAIFYLYGSYMEPIRFWFLLGAILGLAQMIDILSENIWPTEQKKDQKIARDT